MLVEENKTKVCKVCGKEKPVGEFHSHLNKRGKIDYNTKCKVCTWFENNKNYIIKDGWGLEDYILIIHSLLIEKLTLNDISIIINKNLLELCDVVTNFLKVKGSTPLIVKYQCDNCETESSSSSSRYLSTETHFCSKECNNIYKKGKNYHKIIGVGNCLFCKKEFNIYDNVPDQKFCCQECKSKYYYYVTPKYENKICTNCNNEYTRHQQSERSDNSFCSLECELEYKHSQNWEFRKCEICKEEFECLKSSPQMMCSIQCQGKWQSVNLVGENANGYNHEWSIEDRTILCEWCGLEHQAKPYQIEFGRRFCSEECRRDWFAKDFSVSEENVDRARIQAVKNLSDGIYNKDPTGIQVKIDMLLKNLNIVNENEYNCKYYAVDNFLTEHNLMIEIQGQFWHADPRFYKEISYEMQVKRIKSDKSKHTYIKKYYDIEVLYLWESDINNNLELCKLLINEYINNKGVLNNYNSFNYNIINNILTLNEYLIMPYMEYKSEDIREITDTIVKEKMSHKQLDKWITFNCDYCGKETEQLISHYKGENHFCSRECSGKASRNKPKNKKISK